MIHYMTADGLGSPWVGNELRIVGAAGVPYVLHTMRSPSKINFGTAWAQRIHDGMTKPLYPIPFAEFVLANLLAPLLFHVRWFGALANALFGERENLRGRVACLAHFFVACMWAFRMWRARGTRPVSHIHAQWAFSSGSIAMYGAWLLGVPFSFTGHAVDLTKQRVALRDKIKRAKFIIAISEWHKQFYIEQDKNATPDLASKIHVAYCGIYTHEMKPPSADALASKRREPYTILAAGRLIGKKGFPYLLEACKLLKDRQRHKLGTWDASRPAGFRVILAGSGPDEAMLRGLVAKLGLADVVTMTGQALAQEKIPSYMHQGDVFVLPCVWAEDGDVDGLPQLTMEAMGCGVPAITTRLVGNPDLVKHEETGLLVPANDAESLANAIERMMADAELSQRCASAGRAWVLEKFDIARSLEPLLNEYRKALGQPARVGERISLQGMEAAA
jgi:glycosyltransferase involved in cell wall biosynthesis